MYVCRIAEGNADGLIKSIERLANKYYLVENLFEQGAKAADQWLSCENSDDRALHNLVEKYKHLTMFELGIEGINEKHEQEQKLLYSEIDQSVGKLRRRAVAVLLLLIGVACGAAGLWIYL
jgi:hypothetical protein